MRWPITASQFVPARVIIPLVPLVPFHAYASQSRRNPPSSAPHPPFVWYNPTSDDQRRVSQDFSYFPRLLSDPQQRTLLTAALGRLDHVRSHAHASRRKRNRLLKSPNDNDSNTSLSRHVTPASFTFLPDEFYDFEQVSNLLRRLAAIPIPLIPAQGHFDQVIVKFREARVAQEQWPDQENVLPILNQITSLLPPVPLQTHILHLATDGHILPHVDNLQASGSFVLGVSLGAPRILRLHKPNPDPSQNAKPILVCDLLLEPGSVYIQK